MSYGSKILTSIFGRRLGLQRMSSAETGGTRGTNEFLVGPESLRLGATTAETTSTNLQPFGLSVLPGTSAGSSAVYTLDPPIPGVMKFIAGSTDNGPVFVKTANGETISTTLGSSWNTVKISSFGGSFLLVGLTTARWLSLGLTSGTSSQASGFGITTST
jgi:hypothetical protein